MVGVCREGLAVVFQLGILVDIFCDLFFVIIGSAVRKSFKLLPLFTATFLFFYAVAELMCASDFIRVLATLVVV